MRRGFRLFGIVVLVAIAGLVVAGLVARAYRNRRETERFHRVALAPDAGAPVDDGVLRFVAVGDTGKGNDTQFQVARAMGRVCDARGGCAFGLLLGDNLYPSGATSTDDEAFDAKFERPYAGLSFPFWVVLGNHDYGGNGRGTEFAKGQVQIDYTRKSRKWRLPGPFYAFTAGPVDFFAVDTNSVYVSDFSSAVTDLVSDLPYFAQRAEDQDAAIAAEIARSTQPWRIAFGHHPYVSNGRHGDAGGYDGVPGGVPGAGATIKRFFERRICGQVHVYLCGHDHNLQDLGKQCGTEFLLSGGGAAATSIASERPVPFAKGTEGFLLVEATPAELTFRFFDVEASLLHERAVRRAPVDAGAH